MLTLHQPWATLMAAGLKRVETRSWRTSWAGLVAIHAGRNVEALEVLSHSVPLRSGLHIAGAQLPDGWFANPADRLLRECAPLGAIVGVGMLQHCERTETLVSQGAFEEERPFGNYGPGRFGLVFEAVVPVPTPMPARGHQGLREISDAALTDTLRALWYQHYPEREPRYLRDLAAR
jgi:hypothetical protein